MRHRKIAIFTLLFLLTLSFASAHSGRTDSKGGHRNRSTGQYHYHHGYSEHQHKDRGKTCPILYDEGYDEGYEENYEKSYDVAFENHKEFGAYDAFIAILPFPIILILIIIVLIIFTVRLKRKESRCDIYD